MTLADQLDAALSHTPELQTAPDLALAAAQTPDPVGTGRVLAHTVNVKAQDDAVSNVSQKVGSPDLLHKTLRFFGGALGNVEHGAGKIVGGALHVANLPLQEVQHAYRAIHDVEARHGPVAALLEGLGIVAGGALAVAAAPEALAAGAVGGLGILGAEATASLGNRLFFGDSWSRTQDGPSYRGIYNRQTGQYSGGPVSVGRDLAAHLPHPLRFVSGITDGLADLTLDPTIVAGKMLAAERGARLAVNTVEQLDRALSSPITSGSVTRAFQQIAEDPSATRIALRYPKFAPIAGDLAKLDSVDAVTEHFRSILGAAEHLDQFPGELPNLPLTRVPFQAIRDRVRSGDGNALRVFQLLPTDFDPKLNAFSNKDFDPSGQRWATGVYRALRFGQNDTTARMVTDAMLATDDLGLRRDIYKNGIFNMLTKGRGLDQDSDFVRNIMQRLENTTPLEGGPEGIYALSADGRNLSLLPKALDDGSTVNRAAAVLENQTGRWAFPDYMEMVRAERAQTSIKNVVGAADDFFYHHFTEAVFKRGALLTGGFALRIAAAEAIPAAFREGFLNLVRSSAELHLGAKAAKLGDDEAGHIGAAVQRLLGGITHANPEDVDLATRAVVDNGGHMVVRGLDADAHGAAGVSFLDTPEGNRSTLLQKLWKRTPPVHRYGDEFGVFGMGPDHADTWQKALGEIANSELGQTAARELHGALGAGASMEEATQRAADAVRDVLDEKPAQWLGKYERHFVSSVDGVPPHEDWGRVVTEAVKGVTGVPTDPERLHMSILEGIAQSGGPVEVGRYARAADRENYGKVLSISQDGIARVHFINKAEGTQAYVDLPVSSLTTTSGGALHPNLSRDALDAIAPAERPMVKGRIEMPPIPEGPINKVAQLGYQHVIDPIINFLSREPLYFNELKKQYGALRPLIDDGILSADEALRISQARSVINVTPFIHNPLERSQFAQLSRNFMPFYFAQTQAYRRVGRLLADNPGAFRQFQLASSALHDIGHTEDENGTPSFVYPGSGFLAHGTIGALGLLGINVAGSTPVSFSGNVNSLQSVFPFNEEGGGLGVGPIQARFGPLMSIPVHAIETLFPEFGVPLANKVLGPVGASGGIIDQLLPNTPIRNLLKAQGMFPGGERQLQNAMVQTIQSLSFRQNEAMRKWQEGGQQGPKPDLVPGADASPMVRQQFVTRVRNQARILLYLKAAISAVAPAAPQVSAADLGLQQEFRDLIAQPGADGKPLGLSGAVTEFLARHPDATPYTVFGSASDTLGAYLPSNQAAQDFINGHMGTLKKYPYAGAWFIPQTDDPYSQAVYNEQLAMGLRHKKAPEQFIKDVYIAQGNDQFYNRDYPAFQQALAQVGNDRAAQTEVRKQFNAYIENQLGPQNPVWWADFKSPERDQERALAIQQLQAVFQNGDAPPGQQTDLVRSLLEDYRTYNGARTAGRQDSWSAQQRDEARRNWQAYLDGLAKEQPALAPLIFRVFRSA